MAWYFQVTLPSRVFTSPVWSEMLKALNTAAKEIKDIFEKDGRKTGLGTNLPE